MSGASDREAVFPTRQSLGVMKAKLKGAETGHNLLKRKSEALTKRFRGLLHFMTLMPTAKLRNVSQDITKRIDTVKCKMGRVMQIATFSLAEVKYAAGRDVGYQIQGSVKSAKFRLCTKQDNVSGVLLPRFESVTAEGNDDFSLTGLGKGGQQVHRCRETYTRAVEALVELASLQTAFVILDEVIKVVNRRGLSQISALAHHIIDFRVVNAIEHVIIPRTENTIKYINSELDELDREEFYRLKKVANNKHRDLVLSDETKEIQLKDPPTYDNIDSGKEASKSPVDVFTIDDVKDVIF